MVDRVCTCVYICTVWPCQVDVRLKDPSQCEKKEKKREGGCKTVIPASLQQQVHQMAHKVIRVKKQCQGFMCCGL